MDGIPARITNSTRTNDLPLVYPPIPNPGALPPVGPGLGDLLPYTKLDLMQINGEHWLGFYFPVHSVSLVNPLIQECRLLLHPPTLASLIWVHRPPPPSAKSNWAISLELS